MKVRIGFVSNSSSVSFVIYGVWFEEDEDWAEKIANEIGLESEHGQEFGIYVGRNWKNIRDTETGAHFKESVEKLVRENFGPDLKCATHEVGYYNG